ncbi:acyl carrier protein [Legionella clemsonensis]|uniref:acyl carrier protein n=1 Tax=Legionella clemsonensis TaxID=1867846 RepID=UPI0012FE4B10
MLKGIIEIVSSLSPSGSHIAPYTEIIQQGFIDSLSVFNIIVNIERTFNVSIGIMDATIEDFQTPQSIAQLIKKLVNDNSRSSNVKLTFITSKR